VIRRIAPSNMERQLDRARGLYDEGSSTSSGSRRGGRQAEPWIASPRHITLYGRVRPASRGSSLLTCDRHILCGEPYWRRPELALDWAMEAPYHVDVTGWFREVC